MSSAAQRFREQSIQRQRDQEAQNNVLLKFVSESRALADSNNKCVTREEGR
jgi:hypothetical protein